MKSQIEIQQVPANIQAEVTELENIEAAVDIS
jgi:hypothetical protein